MNKQVEEYQIKKAADLEVTKAKIVAKQRKDEKRYVVECKMRDNTFKKRNRLADDKRIKCQGVK